jgi:amino acid transporter
MAHEGDLDVGVGRPTSAQPVTLERTLTLLPLLLFGISYITPFIVLTTFGIFAVIANGALASSYALATVAMLFTAISYGKLAAIYPRSGSAYTYVRKAIDSRVGFMVGWAIMLDYVFLPMVAWLIGIGYLTAEYPSVPKIVWLVLFIGITTVVNIVGLKLATRVNLILIGWQILILALFIIFALHRVLSHDTHGFSTGPFWNGATTITAVSAGAAITAYSFIGFDAVSTFSEEAKDPRKTVPRAIILSVVIAGLIFVVAAYVAQLVHPGGIFTDPNSAPLDIAREIGGAFFGALFLATVILAQFTAGIPIQAAGARLMYAMGRDNVLPRRAFGFLHQKYRTPIFNLALIGLVGFIAMFLSVTTSTSFINFGAFTAFAMTNIAVITQYWRDRHTVKRNPFSWVLLPVIGLAVIIWLFTHLDRNALILGSIWIVLGFCCLLWLTRGFQRPPPVMDFDEAQSA